MGVPEIGEADGSGVRPVADDMVPKLFGATSVREWIHGPLTPRQRP